MGAVNMGLNKSWVDLQCAVKIARRLFNAPEIVQHTASIVVRFRKVRLELYRRTVAAHRLIKMP